VKTVIAIPEEYPFEIQGFLKTLPDRKKGVGEQGQGGKRLTASSQY